MADVFISHASSDRDASTALERMLTESGFSVWWDRDLMPGRSYRKDITAEANAAAAVVVVWSLDSVESDWVYSEACRARDQGKLIQVRADHVGIEDLPAPFDAYHCPPASDVEAVLRSVRTLAEPPPEGRALASHRQHGASEATQLPRGNVALLRAELERSARQVHDLGDSWLTVLARQREICLEVWERWHGQALSSDPDAALVAFVDAADAVGAAVALQRGMLGTDWPAGARVAMRVGVHTGSLQPHGDGYAGVEVVRALGVGSAAHPGQILLTEATVHLITEDLPADHEVLPLGEHTLTDVAQPLRLFQIAAPGLASDFPALRTLGAQGSLPEVMGPIVGRERESSS